MLNETPNGNPALYFNGTSNGLYCADTAFTYLHVIPGVKMRTSVSNYDRVFDHYAASHFAIARIGTHPLEPLKLQELE